MDKKAIAEILDEMGTLLELQGANPFKSRAYHNASRVVEGLTSDVVELAKSGELNEAYGIGQKIQANPGVATAACLNQVFQPQGPQVLGAEFVQLPGVRRFSMQILALVQPSLTAQP